MFGSELSTAVMAVLGDGQGDYLDAGGAVLATGIVLIWETGVERIDVANGMMDRVNTITVNKADLPKVDRRGSFVPQGPDWGSLSGKQQHIDGIASDDGCFVTFYVVC